MFNIREIIEKERNEQIKLYKMCQKQIVALPEGTLLVSKSKGKNYYSKCQEGEKVYLGRYNEEVEALQKHHMLMQIMKRIECNEPLMNQFLKHYMDPSPENVADSMGKAYQFEEGAYIPLFGKRNENNWGEQEYERNRKYPETLVHRTMKGDFVRSKSEVIIANSLFMKGLQYRSEELTKVGKYVFAPDFKILVPSTNQIKLLEHFGMMHDSEYRKTAMFKIETYLENGYRPYEDILFTFEDLDGNIDAQNLDKLITNYCM